jgi:predicted ArsR family transcriptional regulator
MAGRQEDILLYLKSQGSATLGEVAAALGMTKQGALRHLDSLSSEGLVTVEPRKHGRGRPAHEYALAAKAGDHFPQGHKELAHELVEFLPQDQLRAFFKRRARTLEAEYGARLAGLDLEARVQELARLASEHGHMADVVKGEDGGYEIRHHNCPIADVAALGGHPCQVERDMYRRLLGAPVKRESWIPDGVPSCNYVIRGVEAKSG